jgi:hypothetical protein
LVAVEFFGVEEDEFGLGWGFGNVGDLLVDGHEGDFVHGLVFCLDVLIGEEACEEAEVGHDSWWFIILVY